MTRFLIAIIIICLLHLIVNFLSSIKNISCISYLSVLHCSAMRGALTGLASNSACSHLLSLMLSQRIQSLLVHLNVYRAAPQSGGCQNVQQALFMSPTHSGNRALAVQLRFCFPDGRVPACVCVCARSRWAIVLLLGRRGESRPPPPPQWPYGNRAGPLSARQWRHHGGRAGDHV